MSHDLELIRAVCDALSAEGTKEAVLRRSMEAVVAGTGVGLALVWTVDEARTELRLRASAGLYTGAEAPAERVPLDRGTLGEIVRAARPLTAAEIPEDLGDPAAAREAGLSVFVGYPLILEGLVVGVVGLLAAGPLPPDTLEVLSAVADILALGIGRKRATLGRAAAAEELRAALAAQASIARDNARLLRDAQRLIAQLEETNEELDRFAYVTSHDLKAPLRGIENLSQWIEDDLGDRMTDQVREHVHKLRGRVRRLEGLIDGILCYSRIGRTKAPPERVALPRLVKEVLELIAPPPHVTLRVEPDLPTVTAERLLLSQVFMNLIGNAVKYGHPDRVTIEVGARDLGEAWEIHVRDDGPGIPPEQHERIWRVFQTLQPRDRVESTGIGLAIVKKIVASAGGRVRVESEVGQGATFLFTWPKTS